jgi:hypothetical protein
LFDRRWRDGGAEGVRAQAETVAVVPFSQSVTNLVENRLEGAQSFTDHIFALMVFDLWHQEYIDNWPRRQAAVFREVAGDKASGEPVARSTTTAKERHVA